MFFLLFNLSVGFIFIGVIDIFSGFIVFLKYYISLKRGIKTYKDRINLISQTTNMSQIEFYDSECIINSNDDVRKKEIPLSLIEDHYESKNYYFVVFSGKVIISLYKDGFELGTYTDFKKFINNYPKSKNILVIVLGICLSILLLLSLYFLYEIIKWLMFLGLR